MSLRPKVVVAVAALAISCVSQDKQTPPTFKAKTEMVVVPVIVTSGSVPVEGLRAEDFTVKQDGRETTISTFETIDTHSFPFIRQPDLPPRTVQNFLQGGEGKQDLVILLLDFLNSSWSSGARIRSYLADMVRKLEETKAPFAVCVTTTTGVVQIQGIGNDPRDLLKAVEAWEKRASASSPPYTNLHWGQPFTPISQADAAAALDRHAIMKFGPKNTSLGNDVAGAFDLDNAMMTAQAFEQIAEAYRGIPGRKKLVWFSIGIVGDEPDINDNWNGPEAMFSARRAEKMARAIKTLSDANIAVYPVDANGVVNPTWEEHFSAAIDPHSVNMIPSAFAEKPTNQASLMEFADRTGGTICTQFPDRCLGKVLEDGNHYYVLGFYLDRNTKKGWHKLEVKVNRPNVSVRTRSGFVAGDRANEHWVENDMVLTALASPLDYTAIPISLHWDLVREPGKRIGTELAISSPPHGVLSDPESGRLDVDMLAYVRPAGKPDGTSYPASLVKKLTPDQQHLLDANGFRFRKSLDLAPGTYEVRLLMRDNVARKTGTVSTVITVPGL